MALAGPLVVADPAAVAPRFVLAAALRRCGDLTAAQSVLTPLMTPAQRAWGVFYEAGMIAAGRGDTAAALVALRAAVAYNPASSLAAGALAGQRDLAGERAPAAVDAPLTAAALALLDARDAAPLAALGLFPSDVAVAAVVADAGLAHGRLAAAARVATAALAVTPAYLPARLALATALFRLDRTEEAGAVVAAVLAAAPASRRGRSLRAALAMAAGDVAAARHDFAALTASDGDDAVGWHGLGHALRAVGDAGGAVAAYRRALAAAPHFAEVWWSLANLKTVAFTAADRVAMTALLAEDLSTDDRASLHFALGKADDDAGRLAAAFAHYAAGNAAQRSSGFDRVGHRTFIDRTIATLTPAFFAARAGWGDPAAGPIFVVGLPRSGSTLVEQILGSHPAVEGLSELSDVTMLARSLGRPYPEALADLPPAEFARLGTEYLRRVAPRRRLGPARFVDKFPGNVLHLGLIHLMLPNACVIDVRRGAVATCWSLFKQRFAGGQAYSSDLADLGHYYADYIRLMDHVAAVLPGRVLTLSYEALVDDTETQVRRLLAHAGLPFDPACLAFHTSDRVVRTPSSEQVRQPIFRSGLDDWRRFTPWLGPLLAALGPLADG